jgi:hypothetical protein
LVGDLLLALSQGQLLEETIRFLDRQPGRLHDVQVVDGDGKSFLTEAVAMTETGQTFESGSCSSTSYLHAGSSHSTDVANQE